jgi:hypothetical protein
MALAEFVFAAVAFRSSAGGFAAVETIFCGS